MYLVMKRNNMAKIYTLIEQSVTYTLFLCVCVCGRCCACL